MMGNDVAGSSRNSRPASMTEKAQNDPKSRIGKRGWLPESVSLIVDLISSWH
jgi:hypothetical protein